MGKIVGQKAPFKVKTSEPFESTCRWKIPVRKLALFNLGIDSKLADVTSSVSGSGTSATVDRGATRAVVMQHKTQRPVQFEIAPATRDTVGKWVKQAGLRPDDFLFPSRVHDSPHQYARILEGRAEKLGLDPADYGTRSMRRTKATLIYRRTKYLRAVQLLLDIQS